jgi:tetratricopeptide (TPR) repeat protein
MNLHLVRMRQVAPFALVLVSAAVAVAAYLQALHFQFLSDDLSYLPENAKLLGLHPSELWRLFVEPFSPHFEFLPLRELSYWFDFTLFGMKPAVFRADNIMQYLLCLPLVYATTLGLWRYFRPEETAGAPWAAAAVTALFALHPALVESVVWISGRKYVLPNLFSMLAFWFAVSARREWGLSSRYAAATLLAFVAVMFSKASYVGVAPAIAMLWILFWLDVPAQHRRRLQLLWPFAILFLAGLLTLVFIANNNGTDGMSFYFGVEAVTRTLAVLGWLARLAVSPENRHFFYPVFEDPHLAVMVAMGGMVLAAAATGAVMAMRRRSLEGFVGVVFLLLCMPYMQLIPNHPPSLVSDRYVALAVWPAMLLIVALAWRLKPAPRTALLFIIALAWGFQTVERPRDWRGGEVLIDHDIKDYPGYYPLAYQKITRYQLPKGLYREARETADGIAVPMARNIMVKLVEAENAMHDAAISGDPRDAITRFRDLEPLLRQVPDQVKWNPPMIHFWVDSQNSIALDWQYLAKKFPDDVMVSYNAGLSLFIIHKYKDAIIHLKVAAKSQRLPESLRGKTLVLLGVALLGSGHAAEAETPLRAALEQSPPALSAYCALSGVYKQTGRIEEAARAETECHSRVFNEGPAQ